MGWMITHYSFSWIIITTVVRMMGPQNSLKEDCGGYGIDMHLGKWLGFSKFMGCRSML
jgi:hypothetical protein